MVDEIRLLFFDLKKITLSNFTHSFFLVNKICKGQPMLQLILPCSLDALSDNRPLAMFGKVHKATLAPSD